MSRSGPLPTRIVEILDRSHYWIRILATGGFAICGLLLLMSAAPIFFALFGNPQPMAPINVIYLVGGVGYAIPAIALSRYASGIRAVVIHRTPYSLEEALRRHRRFWSIAGVAGLAALVIHVAGIGLGIVLPNLRAAIERSKARRTVADVRMIGQALERYAIDHQRYPGSEDVGELASLLEPRYLETVPRTDRWGHSLVYEARCKDEWCWDFRLISPGRDGTQDSSDRDWVWALGNPRPARQRRVTNPERPPTLEHLLNVDVIYGSGRLLRAPAEFARGED